MTDANVNKDERVYVIAKLGTAVLTINAQNKITWADLYVGTIKIGMMSVGMIDARRIDDFSDKLLSNELCNGYSKALEKAVKRGDITPAIAAANALRN